MLILAGVLMALGLAWWLSPPAPPAPDKDRLSWYPGRQTGTDVLTRWQRRVREHEAAHQRRDQ